VRIRVDRFSFSGPLGSPKSQNREGNKEMRKKYLPLLGCLLIGSLTSVVFAEDVFEPVKIVHMNNGKAIRCRIGWLEGTKMVCQRFNGSVTLPLQSINLEKTFPKFKKRNGETMLVIHPGEVYRDDNIAVSNVCMIRESANSNPHDNGGNGSSARSRAAQYAVLCEVTNSGNPCQVSVFLTAKDIQGSIRHEIDIASESRVGTGEMAHEIDIASESRVGTGEMATLKKPLKISGINAESQIASLKISEVKRSNISERANAEIERSRANAKSDNLRNERTRALKEHFLK